MSLQPCCLTGFAWQGTPTGRVETLASLPTYVAGDAAAPGAVLVVHDAAGWDFPNARLLADHFAREAGVAVYLPDFFMGQPLGPHDVIMSGNWESLDLASFVERNSRANRESAIVACARALKADRGHKRVGAVGYCFGGWAVFRLGAREFNAGDGPEGKLVDCISAGHPSWLTKEDVDGVGVPVQVLAPERDPVYSPEMKLYTFQTLMRMNVPFQYEHYPGVTHACFTRGDPNEPGERDAMVRGKNSAVAWFKRWLLEETK